MSLAVVDARGKLCPQPLIMTKKALGGLAHGESVSVLIDNDTSRQNVERFLTDNGMLVETTEEGGVFTLTITTTAATLSAPDAAAYCATHSTAPHAVCIRSLRMGVGDDTLGEILMKAFVNTIAEIEPLPGSILFYNTGIFLALNDSPVLDALKELGGRGVEILVCGTCVEYFKKKGEVAVGTVSNMYTIAEALSRAAHVVSP